MGSGDAPQWTAPFVEPVLILTPTGRDATVATAYLHTAGIRTHRCHDVVELCAAMDTAAAGLIADEALPVLAGPIVLLHLRPLLEERGGETYRDTFHEPYASWYPELPRPVYVGTALPRGPSPPWP